MTTLQNNPPFSTGDQLKPALLPAIMVECFNITKDLAVRVVGALPENLCCQLTQALEPIFVAKAKKRARLIAAKNQNPLEQNSAQPRKRNLQTREKVAAMADVSHNSVDRVQYLLTHASPEILAAVRANKGEGQISINKAYLYVRHQKEVAMIRLIEGRS